MSNKTAVKKPKKTTHTKSSSEEIKKSQPEMKTEISSQNSSKLPSVSYKTTTHNDKNKSLISKFFSSVVGEKKKLVDTIQWYSKF